VYLKCSRALVLRIVSSIFFIVLLAHTVYTLFLIFLSHISSQSYLLLLSCEVYPPPPLSLVSYCILFKIWFLAKLFSLLLRVFNTPSFVFLCVRLSSPIPTTFPVFLQYIICFDFFFFLFNGRIMVYHMLNETTTFSLNFKHNI